MWHSLRGAIKITRAVRRGKLGKHTSMFKTFLTSYRMFRRDL